MARVPKTGKNGEEKVRKGGGWRDVAWGCEWSDAVRKVRPAHPHRLAGKPATPDASKPVRRGTETRWGHGEQDGRPSRRVLMSFSLVAEGRGGGEREFADPVDRASELACKCKAIEANVIAHTN